MPLQRRLPKFGFTNLKRVEYKAINLSTLDELAAKKELAAVDFEALVSAGFVSSNDKVKILGNGTLSKGLAVKATCVLQECRGGYRSCRRQRGEDLSGTLLNLYL